MLQIKRVYEPASKSDGARILVERLWPRGLKKTDLPPEGWNKDVAPSSALRTWFSHDPAKWTEFRKRYFAELEAHPDAWEPLLRASKKGRVTLLFSSRDEQHNNAVALRDFLAARGPKASKKSSQRA